jgi:hypothetical protein
LIGRRTRQDPKADIGQGKGLANLDVTPIRVHMVPIDTWPNDLGRFALLLTGAHVSDPFSKIDEPTMGADPSAPKVLRVRCQ